MIIIMCAISLNFVLGQKLAIPTKNLGLCLPSDTFVKIKEIKFKKCLTLSEDSLKYLDCNENDDAQIWIIRKSEKINGPWIFFINNKSQKILTNVDGINVKLEKGLPTPNSSQLFMPVPDIYGGLKLMNESNKKCVELSNLNNEQRSKLNLEDCSLKETQSWVINSKVCKQCQAIPPTNLTPLVTPSSSSEKISSNDSVQGAYDIEI
jgi:hypothetical protein